MGFYDNLSKLVYASGVRMAPGTFIQRIVLYSLAIALIFFLFTVRQSSALAAAAFAAALMVSAIFAYLILEYTATKRMSMMEDVLPDFLTLMASNIRSGLTPERALLLSARDEFGPLKKEIDAASKFAMTGTSFNEAFEKIGEKVPSVSLNKSVRLIVEGIESGGNLAELLDNTASDIRRFNLVRMEVQANVAAYKLFFFVAAALGAPLLYATTNFLMGTVASIKSKLSLVDIATSGFRTPVFFNTKAISPDIVFWFSFSSIVVTALFASFAAGVISTGKESDGLRYVPLIIAISIGVFLATLFALQSAFGMFFAT